MTKLLISVRSAEEAALAQGADLIDIKEPARGSLGAAELETIQAIVEQVAGRVPLSAALGELGEGRRLPPSFAGKLRYAKFGLAGCAAQSDWTDRWWRAIDALPPGVEPVAVAYADWQTARAPEPRTVLARAKRAGCCAFLLDTYDKSKGFLLDLVAPLELGEFIDRARQLGLLSAVAGSLGWPTIERVRSLEPDYIAVRGCVCAGGRAGRLDPRRVARLARFVRPAHTHVAPSGS